MSPAPETPPAEHQDELPGLAEAFKAVGIDNLPTGVADLSAREQRFCLNFLRTARWTESARDAGYRLPEKNAGKLRQNKGIMRFLTQASAMLTEETKQLIIRVEERSKALDALLKQETDKPPEKMRVGRIAKLSAAVTRTDSLLASLKEIGNVAHVSGDISHTHQHQGEVTLTVPATALPVLAEMRQEVVRGQAGGRN